MTDERQSQSGQPVSSPPQRITRENAPPATVQEEAAAPSPSPAASPAPGEAEAPRPWMRRKTPRADAVKAKKERKKSNRSRRAKSSYVAIGNAFFSVLLVVMLGIVAVVEYGRQRYIAPGPLAEERVVDIQRGLGTQDIGDLLERNGVIRNATVFTMGAMATGARGRLQAGEYRFPAGASTADVVEIIASGQVVEHSVTVAEGLTSEQIVQRLLENELLTGTIDRIPPEGSLLPETYRINRGMARAEVIRRMTAARDEVLNEVWAKRDPDVPVNSPFELLVLASIVEKETGVGSERPMVASVFVNRLKKGMRLQSDPTIIYGLVGGKGTLGRGILRSEITRPTAYNTYTIPGLPPGPIANPGRASLEAAARPAKTEYVYFVADGSGGHAFATTLNEHNQNVARWRQIERERGTQEADRVSPEDAPAESQPARRNNRS